MLACAGFWTLSCLISKSNECFEEASADPSSDLADPVATAAAGNEPAQPPYLKEAAPAERAMLPGPARAQTPTEQAEGSENKVPLRVSHT